MLIGTFLSYLGAALALGVFSFRAYRAHSREGILSLRYTADSTGLLALAVAGYGACFLNPPPPTITILYAASDVVLFLGFLSLARLSLYLWIGAPLDIRIFRLLALGVALVLGFNAAQLALGYRGEVYLTERIIVDQAPLYFNVVKVGFMLAVGAATGLYFLFRGRRAGIRAYFIGMGTIVSVVAGAALVVATGPKGRFLLLLGSFLLIMGLVLPPKGGLPGEDTPPRTG